MITVDQYEFVRTGHRVYGKSIRELARETGHSRNTVRKVLRQGPFEYTRRESQPYPVMWDHLDIIRGWLLEDQKQPKKQRHTARRVYNRLVAEHGFMGCESGVRARVRELKRELGIEPVKAFVPLDPDIGREAEVDWGCAEAEIAGERQRIKFFCMRSKYSGKMFVRAYACERQQAFFDAHMHAFHFFGGIFPVLVYDNLTSAVRKVFRGKRREEQESFKRFHAFYSFEPRFCNMGAGHEKGGVEGLIGFARSNFMVPIPQVETLDELNARVLMECMKYGSHRIHGKDGSVSELFEREKECLLAIPESLFQITVLVTAKVDHYATVRVDKNRYSVPTRYGGLWTRVELTVDQVSIYYGTERIAMHGRVYNNNKWVIDPQHYLEIIQQRPGSFDAARPIREWRKSWPECFEKLLDRFRETQGVTKGIKDFVSVLMLHRDYPAGDISAAVELALENRVSTSDGVRHILMHSHTDFLPASLAAWPVLESPDISQYAALGSVS